MPLASGPRYVADLLRAYGQTHVFFVPQMLLETLTGMEGMGIRRVMTHGEKAVGYEVRCGYPTAFDRDYPRALGVGAVRTLLAGVSSVLITRQAGRIVPKGFPRSNKFGPAF